jgi:lipid A oxidase
MTVEGREGTGGMTALFLSRATWARPAAPCMRVGVLIDAFASTAAGFLLIAAANDILSEPALPAASAAERAIPTQPDTATFSPTREWMAAGYLGVPYTYPSDVTIKNAATHDVTMKDVAWRGKPFTNPVYYGLRVARWFDGGRAGSMLDFTHSKAISYPDQEVRFEGTLGGQPAPEKALIKDYFSKLEASHGHNMLTMNGLWRLPNLHARLSPYIGVGAGISLPHAEVHMKTDPARTYEYQYAGPVGQALIGLEFRLKGMSYFVEYKFSLAPYEMAITHQDGYVLFTDLWRQVSRWWSGEAPPGGYVRTTFASHQVIGGLGFRFGAVPAASR